MYPISAGMYPIGGLLKLVKKIGKSKECPKRGAVAVLILLLPPGSQGQSAL